MKNRMKKCCGQLSKSKATKVLCALFYIFLCLFGNIITGIFVYQDSLKQENTETVEETILSSFETSTDYSLILENDNATLEDWLSALEDETTEIVHSFDAILNDSITDNQEADVVCYESIDDYNGTRTSVKYWIEGISILIVGIFGLLGNLLSILILHRIKPKQKFNTLLIALAGLDCLLITDSLVQKSIIPYFTTTSPLDPLWYKLSFPYFWHPFKGIIRTVTMYMMVIISCDRFRAVCYPFHRKYSTRMCILLVIVTSVVLKIPMFFQFKIVTIAGVQQYWTTSIMDSTTYLTFNYYWDELLATGILPLAIIIFLNTRIYLKIRASAKMKCNRFIGAKMENRILRVGTKSSVSTSDQRHLPSIDEDLISKHHYNNSNTDAIERRAENSSKFENHLELVPTSLSKQKLLAEHDDLNQIIQEDTIYTAELKVIKNDTNRSDESYETPFDRKDLNSTKINQKLDNSCQESDLISSNNNKKASCSYTIPISSLQIKQLNLHYKGSKSARLKMTTYKSATILISIVILFLLTHFYRVTLKIYEISTPKNNMKDFTFCLSKNRYHVPMTFYLLSYVNNLFLVINSSINILIYYLMGKEFRKQAMLILQAIWNKLKST